MLMSEATEKIRKVTGFTVPNWILENVVDGAAGEVTKISAIIDPGIEFGWAEGVEEAVRTIIHWTTLSEDEVKHLPKNREEVKKLIKMLTAFRKEFVLTKLITHYHNMGGTWDEND